MAQEKFTIEKIDRDNKFTVLNDFLSKESIYSVHRFSILLAS